MNLELSFGNEKSLIEAFKEGEKRCKPKDIWFSLINIYKREKKLNLLMVLVKNFVSKFKKSSKC